MAGPKGSPRISFHLVRISAYGERDEEHLCTEGGQKWSLDSFHVQGYFPLLRWPGPKLLSGGVVEVLVQDRDVAVVQDIVDELTHVLVLVKGQGPSIRRGRAVEGGRMGWYP